MSRPFLWGQAAVHQYKSRRNLGPSLWKQPGMNDVLDVLDAGFMKKSAALFPLDKELGVGLLMCFFISMVVMMTMTVAVMVHDRDDDVDVVVVQVQHQIHCQFLKKHLTDRM